jgi:signal transduction histidine kinase
VTPRPEGAAAVLATGELEPVAGSVAPILHESGHTFGAVLVFREVGQLRRAEQELRASEERLRSLNVHLERRVEERTAELVCANEALVRASRVKDSFLATMNHELRTPLNAVLGLSEALEEGVYGDLQQQQLRAIGRIDEAGRHLLSLIGDILDLSRLEADRDHIAVESVGARDIAEQSVRLVEASAQRKGQRLSLRTDGAPETLQANARTLKQILVNLLGNAIKFTPDGGAIELAVTADEGAGIVRFVVRDDGPGIAPEDLARIFDPFVQVDNRLARTHAGSGLGLALARRFAAAHGGQVTVESTVDVGSSFTLALPAGVGAASVGPGAGAAGGVTVPGPRLPP